jgi:hypothetical protein
MSAHFHNLSTDYCCRFIPEALPTRAQIDGQLRNVLVSTATIIEQEYNLTFEGTSIAGRSDRGEVASVRKSDCLHIFLTEDAFTSPCPPLELTDLLVDFCGIKDIRHRSLLQMTLSESSSKRAEQLLFREGVLRREDLSNDGNDIQLY